TRGRWDLLHSPDIQVKIGLSRQQAPTSILRGSEMKALRRGRPLLAATALGVLVVAALFGGAAQTGTAQIRGVADPVGVAKAFLQSNGQDHGLTAADLDGLVVSSSYTDSYTGVAHVYLQQRYNGIDVIGGIVNLNVNPDGSILSWGSRAIPDLAASAAGQQPQVSADDAAATAA